jgi:hypothetical protein
VQIRRRLPSCHPFFQQGNDLWEAGVGAGVGVLAPVAAVPTPSDSHPGAAEAAARAGASSLSAHSGGMDENDHDYGNGCGGGGEERLLCDVRGCPCTFATTAEYDAHYKSAHWNMCRVCRRVLPTAFLLDLHLR